MAKTAVLARITCDGDRPFTAGLLFDHGKVVIAAPILRAIGLVGKTGHEVLAICKQKGWEINRVPVVTVSETDAEQAPNSLSSHSE